MNQISNLIPINEVDISNIEMGIAWKLSASNDTYAAI